MSNEKQIIFGISGLSRSGKDTFVKIAKNILKDNGYTSIKLAFADALKEEIDPFLRQHYDISAWTDDTEEKSIIRPYLVAHGCGKRKTSDGKYWIDKIDQAIENIHFVEDVIFVSDCRFSNEIDWIHEKWGGWVVHLKKYSLEEVPQYYRSKMKEEIAHKMSPIEKVFSIKYDSVPNEEEAKNDPICEAKANYKLELENAIERHFRETGNKITTEALVDNSYLINEITTCLSKCPFLTILRS